MELHTLCQPRDAAMELHTLCQPRDAVLELHILYQVTNALMIVYMQMGTQIHAGRQSTSRQLIVVVGPLFMKMVLLLHAVQIQIHMTILSITPVVEALHMTTQRRHAAVDQVLSKIQCSQGQIIFAAAIVGPYDKILAKFVIQVQLPSTLIVVRSLKQLLLTFSVLRQNAPIFKKWR